MRGICMVSTTLSLIAFFALVAWRFVFTGLRRRPLAREIATPRQQHNNVLERGLHILDLAGVAVIPGDRLTNGSDGVHPITPKDRAKTYLRRIVALTGATRTGNAYLLDVGTTRFHVRDRYVGRTQDVTDPRCAYEETCFYSAHKEMPKSEQIATALLQLKNNPALFDRWAAQGWAFKADGQTFSLPSESDWR
jgi:hypothetical protein